MDSKIDPKALLRKWAHAHEEDTPGKKVFRPESSPLPPSRGRTEYEFQTGGRLIRTGPGPTDRRVSTEGTWSLDAQGRLVLQVPGQDEKVLKIESLEDERLVLKE